MKKIRPLGISSDRQGPTVVGVTGVLRRKLVWGHGHGRNFSLRQDNPVIVLPLGKTQDPAKMSDVRLSQVLDTNIQTYSVQGSDGLQLQIAIHNEADEIGAWEVPAINRHLTGTGMVVSEYRHDGQYVLYRTDRHLRVAFSKNLVAWHDSGMDLLSPRKDHFDRHALKLLSVEHLEQGLLVLYESSYSTKTSRKIAVGAALFESDNPTKVIWRSDDPIWEDQSPLRASRQLLGSVIDGENYVIYYTDRREQIGLVKVPHPFVKTARY